MEEKNSFEGITFYYRPEDYEDTIADEDVVDLLDDIELAGIDDETGEVVLYLRRRRRHRCVCDLFKRRGQMAGLYGSGIPRSHHGASDCFAARQ